MLKIFFKMVLNTCKLWSNGIKIASFSQKITKNRPTAASFAPRPPHSLFRPPSMIRLRHTSLLITHPKLHFLGEVEPSTYSKILVMSQHSCPRPLICLSAISLSHKKSHFRKFLMTSLHEICGLHPQSKILARLTVCNALQYFNHDQQKTIYNQARINLCPLVVQLNLEKLYFTGKFYAYLPLVFW